MNRSNEMWKRQRGAALLLAMVILTLIATLASAMVWQQWRAIQVEAAERGRQQAGWILVGALDWARLILREDNPKSDNLGEPWAVPLAEARLSTFLAADKNNNVDDGSAPEAFLSGVIEDAQAKYNLRNLVDGEFQLVPKEVAVLQRLCEIAGAPPQLATQLAEALTLSWRGTGNGAAVTPRTVEELVWLGLDPDALKRLTPWVTLLPEPTTLNLNTAPREVIAAVFEGGDMSTAERLVQARQRKPFEQVQDIQPLLPSNVKLEDQRIGVNTSYFEVRGQVRLGDRVLQERSLVQRKDRNRIVALHREQVNLMAAGS
ncbi:MAG TPA: type II secretion system minor pseudopilin GspK [Burkholderiaceae bacterium]|nr:type II secretion system minor pseudopilin GspK [Burkholderiaceae bacterium]